MTRLHPATFLRRFPIFTTREFAFHCGRRLESASRTLSALAAESALTRITRGIWAQPSHPHFRPPGAVPYLLRREQGYVSFLTALNLQGALAQIPGTFQVATTGHGRQVATPIGTFGLIRIQPSMMRSGFDMQGAHAPYPLASSEKALLDTLYIATRRGRQFARLPELDLAELDLAEFVRLLDTQVRSKAIRKAIESRVARLIPQRRATR